MTGSRGADSHGPIVIFSYHFAPEVRVGGKRWSFLSREFVSRGRDVRVFTREMSPIEERDESLPLVCDVTRCKPSFEPTAHGPGLVARALNRGAHRILEPFGTEIGWARPSFRAAAREVPRTPKGVVIGTLPPPAAAFAAAAFAERMGWPLILDYRDPWTGYGWTRKLQGTYAPVVARFFERRFVRASAARVFTTPEMEHEFVKWFPQCSAERHFVIPNGFDFDERVRSADLTGIRGHDIVYAGEFYGERSFLPLLRALARVRRGGGSLSDARLVVYGIIRDDEMQAAGREGLKELLDVRTRISRDQLIARLRQAAALLVMPSSDMNYSMPYKLYDYLSVGRPILAVAPQGSALQRFVNQYRVGTLADAANEDSIESAIRTCLSMPAAPDASAAIAAHQWTKLADDYLQIVAAVV